MVSTFFSRSRRRYAARPPAAGGASAVLAGGNRARRKTIQTVLGTDRQGRLGGGRDLADAEDTAHRLVRTFTGSTTGSLLAGLAGPPGQRFTREPYRALSSVRTTDWSSLAPPTAAAVPSGEQAQ